MRCPSDYFTPVATYSRRSYAIPSSGSQFVIATTDLPWPREQCVDGTTSCAGNAPSVGRKLSVFNTPSTTFMLVEAPNSFNRVSTAQGYRVQAPSGNIATATTANYMNYQDGLGGAAGASLAGDGKAALHFDGYNYLFFDGHVKWLRPENTIRGGNSNVTYPYTAPGSSTSCAGTMASPCGMWTMSELD